MSFFKTCPFLCNLHCERHSCNKVDSRGDEACSCVSVNFEIICNVTCNMVYSGGSATWSCVMLTLKHTVKLSIIDTGVDEARSCVFKC